MRNILLIETFTLQGMQKFFYFPKKYLQGVETENVCL